MKMIRHKTRRGGVLSDPQKIIRDKQIRGVQTARRTEINDYVRAITKPRRDGRPHWVGPSDEKQERLSELLHKDDKLLAKGKGRSRTRRNKLMWHFKV